MVHWEQAWAIRSRSRTNRVADGFWSLDGQRNLDASTLRRRFCVVNLTTSSPSLCSNCSFWIKNVILLKIENLNTSSCTSRNRGWPLWQPKSLKAEGRGPQSAKSLQPTSRLHPKWSRRFPKQKYSSMLIFKKLKTHKLQRYFAGLLSSWEQKEVQTKAITRRSWPGRTIDVAWYRFLSSNNSEMCEV